MSGSKQILLLTLFKLLAFSLSGQDYFFHHLDQTDGLSNEFNAHITTDKDGYFWTSSRDGLNRFDGKNVRVFRPQLNGTSLDPNITSTIFQDSLGNKWFTSNNALHFIQNETDSVFTFQKNKADNHYYYAFHLDQQHLLWVIIQDSLYTVDVSKRPLSFVLHHAYSGFVAYPWLNSQGEVKGLVRPLIDNRQGIEILSYETEPARDTFFYDHAQQGVRDTFIFYLYLENDSSFWIPCNVGLIHFNPYDPTNFEVFKHDSSKTNFSYRDVKPWGESFLFLGSLREGLFLFDKRNGQFVQKTDHFNIEGTIQKIDGLNNLLIDDRENLWVSFFDFGLIFTNLRNHKFSQLFRPEQLFQQKEKEVRAIIQNEDESLLILIKNEGVYRAEKGTDGKRNIADLPLRCCADSTISNIFKSKTAEHFWILSDDQLSLIDDRSGRRLKSFRVSKYTYDFVELENGGFLLLDINKLQFLPENFSQDDLVQPSSIIAEVPIASRLFYFSETGLVFLVQANNLIRLFDASQNFKELKQIDKAGHLNGASYDQKNKVYWLASSTGLFKYEIEQAAVKQVSQPELLVNRSFTDVVLDKNGNVWLSSYWGLYQYLPDKDSVNHFTQSDGLYTMQYEENVSFTEEEGIIYFAGDNGLTFFNPGHISLNMHPAKIVLQEVKINSERVPNVALLSSHHKYVIPYHKNNLSLNFAVIEFSDPMLNSFEAYLIRGERDTVAQFFSEQINLPDIRQGSYRLFTFATNSDGIKTQETDVLSFVVLPPWFLQWWALIIWGGVLLGLLYVLYKYRVRQIEKKEAAKRQEAEFRQKEAEYKQLVAETETAVLRLQMNPHFIFNSMNAINSYILQNDVKTANSYLNHFAKLMRQILELSSHPLIEIAEEIEFLQLFLETETMRLGKKLSYQFEVAPDLDEDDTLIPTMILQPFVENAIWHGISPKREGGMIFVRFLKSQGQLLCEVEDNGVGRNVSKDDPKKHKSKAIDITRRRLALLSGKYQKEMKMSITDLYNDDGDPSGTKVSLYLPLIE